MTFHANYLHEMSSPVEGFCISCKKEDLRYHANYFLTICMKYQILFSRQNKTSQIKSIEFAQMVIMVKVDSFVNL